MNGLTGWLNDCPVGNTSIMKSNLINCFLKVGQLNMKGRNLNCCWKKNV